MHDPATPVTFAVTVGASEMAVPAASPAAGAAVTIQMTDQLRFAPRAFTIDVGQTVTWINESAIPHTTTGDTAENPVAQDHLDHAQLPAGAAPCDSGPLQTGQSFSYTFTVPGTYHYFCTPMCSRACEGRSPSRVSPFHVLRPVAPVHRHRRRPPIEVLPRWGTGKGCRDR